MAFFDHPFRALVIGSNGGIGAAVTKELQQHSNCAECAEVNRVLFPDFDMTNEGQIKKIADIFLAKAQKYDLIFDATGGLEVNGFPPEKAFKQLEQPAMEAQFALNAMGPALLMKYFLPLLPKNKAACFASLSARVGSIEDNGLGGWMSYRAAKAALNQFIKCASIEQQRKNSNSIVIGLHPGTVATKLSEKYAKSSMNIFTPEQSATKLLSVIHDLTADQSGYLYAYDGAKIPF